MSPVRLAEVVSGRLTGWGTDAGSAQERTITTVVTDSREAAPGALFVAISGERTDGHAHAAAAVAAGAVCVLAERELTDPGGRELPTVVVEDTTTALGALARAELAGLRAQDGRPLVLAVTGSVGKTTTKDLLTQLFGAAGETVAPVRSFNNEVGLPVTVLRSDERTDYLVLEMGADAPGNLDYLTSIAPPDVAAVLVVGHAHLAGMGGVSGVAREKASILAALGPGGTAVLNEDDLTVAGMVGSVPDGVNVLRFGRSPRADVQAQDVTVIEGSVRFTLVHGQEREPVRLRLLGEHHLTNALAAAGVAVAAGLPLADVARGLSEARPLSPHRMALAELPGGITLVDDSYNANPDSVRAALRALSAIAAGRRTVAILGEMRELGEDSTAEHDAVGRLAVRLGVDHLLVVGAGARPMFVGAQLEGSFGDEAAFVPDIEAAKEWWRLHRRPGDVVLVKSSNGAGLHVLADALLAEADTSRTEHPETSTARKEPAK